MIVVTIISPVPWRRVDRYHAGIDAPELGSRNEGRERAEGAGPDLVSKKTEEDTLGGMAVPLLDGTC